MGGKQHSASITVEPAQYIAEGLVNTIQKIDGLKPISSIKIGTRFRKDIGDLTALKESIQEVGLLHPIVIDEESRLIAGFRRIKACEQLGWAYIPFHLVPLKDLRKGECHENALRKDFTCSEIVAIKRALEPEIKKRAEERKRAGVPSADSAEGDTRDKIARFVGKGHDTVAKAEKIVEAAEKRQGEYLSLLQEVDNGGKTINEASIRLKRLEENEAAEQGKVQRPIPKGLYSILLVDPPWEPDFSPTSSRRVQKHYPVMTLDELKQVKIPAAKDAMLFLWSTPSMLKQALELMEAWGFEYRTNAVWDKEVIGTGYYFRAQHELLLLGRRGKFRSPAPKNRKSSVIREKRTEHSKKPVATYDIIERMFPSEARIELFARNEREGWASWGNEP